MSKMPKVVVTDFIEPDMDWDARQLAERGVDFAALQLTFRPEEEVIVVNMVKITAPLPARARKPLAASQVLPLLRPAEYGELVHGHGD